MERRRLARGGAAFRGGAHAVADIGAPVSAVADAALPEASDAALLGLVAGRDRAAFELLYRRYVRTAFGLALGVLRDRERAEEAVQDAFAAVWRSAGSYDAAGGAADAWLYALVRAASGVGDGREEASLVAWRVHRALGDLPPREREAVELAYWSGMAPDELAGHLGLPPEAVRTELRSALSTLSGLLAAAPA